ncbi:hypothetical protein BKA70DRAFT_1403095, partial [Coprinopsis sp. MPI-PUGE-AT-0042]
MNGHEGVIKLLLARPEIQVNLVDDQGLSALMLAAKWGHESVVRLLLDIPHLNTAATSIEEGHTAMSIALVNSHMEIAQLLQEFELPKAGPAPDSQDSSADTVVDAGPVSTSKPSAKKWAGSIMKKIQRRIRMPKGG